MFGIGRCDNGVIFFFFVVVYIGSSWNDEMGFICLILSYMKISFVVVVSFLYMRW